MQLLAIKIRQREGQSLESIKDELTGTTGDALERKIATALAPALGARADSVSGQDDGVVKQWKRVPIADGIELHVREDIPAARDNALLAMRESVRAALGREDIR